MLLRFQKFIHKNIRKRHYLDKNFIWGKNILTYKSETRVLLIFNSTARRRITSINQINVKNRRSRPTRGGFRLKRGASADACPFTNNVKIP
jgi:hypothetical protein